MRISQRRRSVLSPIGGALIVATLALMLTGNGWATSQVVYLGDQDTTSIREAYSVDSRTGQFSKINQPISPLLPVQITGVGLNRKGTKAIYSLDSSANDTSSTLFLVNLLTHEITPWVNIATGNDFEEFQIDPKGAAVIYAAAKDDLNSVELFETSLVTAATRKLSEPSFPQGTLVFDFVMDAKGTGVAYIADPNSQEGLFYVNRKTGEHQTLVFPSTRGFPVNPLFDAKGRSVFFVSPRDTVGVDELFQVDVNTLKTVKLNAPLVSGGDVHSFAVDPSGKSIAYVADQDGDTTNELYLVDLATHNVHKVNPPLVAEGDVSSSGYAFDPKGANLYYIADQDIDGTNELYRAELASGAVTKVNPPFPAGRRVREIAIHPKGTSVLYRADQDLLHVNEVYLYDVKTRTVRKVHPSLPAGRNVDSGISFDLKGTAAFFRGDFDTESQSELLKSELKTATVQVLSGPFVPAGDVDGFAIPGGPTVFP